ncbi:hypothetical protein [Brevibacterium sp. HMSC08F02]|uniref:type I restriction endonuclease subunit R, EcoR124 family n=1 Tax=Brevibacterium sp. HMSC08F02 TaxID=1581140 RepID=UPI001C4033C0|nr:hypothetical protein [Brevibacterium sp. HMSC08F02]
MSDPTLRCGYDLSPRDMQDLQSVYLEIREELGGGDEGPTDGSESYEQQELEFEIELLRQVDVNVDYILMLVEKLHTPKSSSTPSDDDVKEQIRQAIDASPTLRGKRDLFMDFIEAVDTSKNVVDQWNAFVQQRRERELGNRIQEQNLREPQARAFVDYAFEIGEVPTTGTDIVEILPPMSLFGRTAAGDSREDVRKRVVKKFIELFERYGTLG